MRLELTRALGNQGEVVMLPRQRANFVVDASLLRIQRKSVAEGLEVRADITLIVSDARSGAMKAVLSGRGGVRTPSDTGEAAETAVAAAIRSAVRPLGRTLRALPQG